MKHGRRKILGILAVGTAVAGVALLAYVGRPLARIDRHLTRTNRPGLASVIDRSIWGAGRAIPLRIYQPSEERPAPVLIFLHGGGWAHGDLDSHDHLCRQIAAASGFLVVAVGYRLAPEHPFPAALDDAYAVAQWIANNGRAIGADAGCMAVGGDSAGGNLAAAVALLARDRSGPRFAAQVLLYPVLDDACDAPSYTENERYGPTRAEMRNYWDQYAPTDAARRSPYAAPLRAWSLAGLPPSRIVTAGLDTLRDEGEAYAERLRKDGVPTTLTRYPTARHAFLTVSDSALTRQAIQVVAEALRSAHSDAALNVSPSG